MRLIDGVGLLVDYIESRCFLLHVRVRFEGSRSRVLEAMLALNAIKNCRYTKTLEDHRHLICCLRHALLTSLLGQGTYFMAVVKTMTACPWKVNVNIYGWSICALAIADSINCVH